MGADPKKDLESIDRIVDNVKAEAERRSSEWIGDAEGMVE
jgi:hypothetical protein